MKNVQNKVPSVLIIICLVGFPQISESIFTPALPALSHAMSVSAKTSQLTMSTYFIAFAVGVLFWGFYSDKVGRIKAMLLGLGVYLIGNIGLLFSPNFVMLLLFRLVQSFGASAGSGVTQSIMRESFTGIKASKVFATVTAAMALSPALGPFIGGIAQTYFGYQSVFSVLIIMAVSLILYTNSCLPETRIIVEQSESIRVGQVIRKMITDRRIWIYGFIISGINGVLFSYYAEAPFVFITHFKLSAIMYGLTGIVLAGANICGAMLVNKLVSKHSYKFIITLGLVTAIIASVTLLISSLMNSMIPMLISIFVVFAGLNITLPIVLQLALEGYEKVIGLASGIFSFGYYIVISFLTYLISFLHNGQIYVLPMYVLALSVAMLISYSIMNRK